MWKALGCRLALPVPTYVGWLCHLFFPCILFLTLLFSKGDIHFLLLVNFSVSREQTLDPYHSEIRAPENPYLTLGWALVWACAQAPPPLRYWGELLPLPQPPPAHTLLHGFASYARFVWWKAPHCFLSLTYGKPSKKTFCSSSRVEQKLLYRRKVRRMIWAVSGLGGLEAFSCLPSGSCQRPASSQEEGWNPRVLPADSPNKQLLCSKAASLGAHLVFTATRKPWSCPLKNPWKNLGATCSTKKARLQSYRNKMKCKRWWSKM